MEFVKLDISQRTLTRKDFRNQPRKLFVLPDNLPDFRLPRNKLHTSQRRGGLAECMRPNKIGGTKDNPVYDVNVVGVPTLSFDKHVPLTPKHIEEAFEGIYRLLGSQKFDKVVVPYKNGKPAFGGGVAGNLPEDIQTAINKEFTRLKQLIHSKEVFTKEAQKKWPKRYLDAFREGCLLRLTSQNGWMTKWLNNPPNWMLRGTLIAMGAVMGTLLLLTGSVYFGIILSAELFSLTLMGSAFILGSGIISTLFSGFLFDILSKAFFGELKSKFSINGGKGWFYQKGDVSGGISKLFGFFHPYKTTLEELSSDIEGQLSKQWKIAEYSGSNSFVSGLSQVLNEKANVFTKYYTKQIITARPELFYLDDQEKVKSSEYDVEKAANKYFRG